MKNTITEMKNTLDGINSGVHKTEDQIRDLKDQKAENSQSEQQKEKRFLKNEATESLWDNFKHTNIYIMGVPEREDREQRIKNQFEIIITENFPNLVKEIDVQVQEAE